jgi:hypothetical protein
LGVLQHSYTSVDRAFGKSCIVVLDQCLQAPKAHDSRLSTLTTMADSYELLLVSASCNFCWVLRFECLSVIEIFIKMQWCW